MRTLQGKKSSKAVVRNVSQISVDAGLSKYPLIVTGRSIDVSIFEFSGNIVFIILLIRWAFVAEMSDIILNKVHKTHFIPSHIIRWFSHYRV